MNWKKVLKGIMPIASTIIGTANPLAGAALRVASKAILGKEDGTEAEVELAFAGATAADIASMRKADQDFEKELSDNNIDLEKIHADDRSSAREMHISTQDNAVYIIAALFIIGYFTILYAVLTGGVEIAESNKGLVYTLIGILSAGVTQVMNFFFGSSKGSKDKTQALSAVLRK